MENRPGSTDGADIGKESSICRLSIKCASTSVVRIRDHLRRGGGVCPGAGGQVDRDMRALLHADDRISTTMAAVLVAITNADAAKRLRTPPTTCARR